MVNYFIEMWVHRANLYHALVALEEHGETLFLQNIVMPDGRRFPSHPKFGEFAIREDWQPALSMQTYLTIDLLEDETLRDWNCENLLQNGLYMVDLIELEIDDLPYNRQWLESEADLILLRFGAHTGDLNMVIAYSDSLHGWAIDLARAADAYSCAIRSDSGSLKLLYVRGEAYTSVWSGDGPDCPFGLGALIGLPVSETAKRAVALENACLPDDGTALINGLRDADSGVRGKALQVLGYEESARAYNAVLTALDDDDWRLRALALDLLSNFDEFEQESVSPFSQRAVERKREHQRLIEAKLTDRELGVRLQAVRALRNYPRAIDGLSQILLETPLLPRNLALLKAAFDALCWCGGLELHDKRWATLQAILRRPDFPFLRAVKNELGRV